MTSTSGYTFGGYTGQVWQATYAALGYYLGQITSPAALASPATTVSISKTMLSTLLNAVDAINAYSIGRAWQAEASNLLAVSVLPLSGVDPLSATYFNARLAAYQTAAPALTAIAPQPPFPTGSALSSGVPAIPYSGLLEFYEAFAYETPPLGLTSATFAADAAACANAFDVVFNAIAVSQGSMPTQLRDVAFRQYLCAQEAAYFINSFGSGPVAFDVGFTNAWNQIVTLTAMVADAAVLNGNPSNQANQQSVAMRYALLTIANQIATLLLVLGTPPTAQIQQTVLLNGETLMDVAARALGNFELWTQIATLNGLQPPYTAAQESPGVAAWGSTLILPSPGVSSSAAGIPPSYNDNFLGTDLYVGPINGSMPAWTGDFQTITGISNLAWALGRRLQTPLGSLIYHGAYGSRIPAEIGAISDASSAAQINAFGKSALLSDPRVRSVPSAIANLLSGTSIQFTANVQPIGNGQQNASVNEVIGT